jgi:nicotinate-nucleotide adenylyltransferase
MIGLLGGTFDPVHYAHLRCALEVQQVCDFDSVRFIPCRRPPHRMPPHASPRQRLAMLKLALRGQPGFEIDERELHRDGPSYMVDTLLSLRSEVGARPLCLLIGMDAFAQLDSWHRWEELAGLAHFAVMRRPALSVEPSAAVRALMNERLTRDPQRLRHESAGSILLCTVTQIDISATRIRELVASGRSARYLLPDPVLDYIRRERLYLDIERGVAGANG